MVECTALEMRRAFTGTVGSNPTLSATAPQAFESEKVLVTQGHAGYGCYKSCYKIFERGRLAEHYKKVPGHRHLYRLGSSYYFRRGVPKAKQGVFGKTAVAVSLGSVSLAVARHRLLEHLREFDQKAGLVEPPAVSLLPTTAFVPDRAAINAGVRSWVADALRRSDPLTTQRALGEHEMILLEKEQARLIDQLAWQPKAGSPARLETEWIAEHLCRSLGWTVDPASPQYRYLFNTVRQGEVEIAARAYEIQDEQDAPVRNASLFGPLQYAADATLRPASPPLHVCLDRFLTRSASKANEKTRAQSRQRLGVMLDALGRDRGVGTITKADCRKLRDEVLRRLPANYTKRFRGMTAREAADACARTGGSLLSSKTQSLMVDQLKTFFEWALDEDLVMSNPARAIEIAVHGDTIERRPFSATQLVSIFNAPLYTGCVDDARNYFRTGDVTPVSHPAITRVLW